MLSGVTIPSAMFTNGIRIVGRTYLTLHVDRGFLYGDLHHKGGALFSLISVAVLLSKKSFAGRAGLSHQPRLGPWTQRRHEHSRWKERLLRQDR